MYNNLLPIGSVVLLKGGNKRIMICGRVIARMGENAVYDYTACYYPEGIMDPTNMQFFNHDAIERVYFVGFQDTEELKFHEQVLDTLGELEVRDGKIVQKTEIE